MVQKSCVSLDFQLILTISIGVSEAPRAGNRYHSRPDNKRLAIIHRKEF